MPKFPTSASRKWLSLTWRFGLVRFGRRPLRARSRIAFLNSFASLSRSSPRRCSPPRSKPGAHSYRPLLLPAPNSAAGSWRENCEIRKNLRYFARSHTRRESLVRTATQLRQLRKQALECPGPNSESVRPSLMGFEGNRRENLLEAKLPTCCRPSMDSAHATRKSRTDAVNAALNYGYGVLYSHAWGAAMNAARSPSPGCSTSTAAVNRPWSRSRRRVSPARS